MQLNLKILNLKIRFIKNEITENSKVQYIFPASLPHYYKEDSFLKLRNKNEIQNNQAGLLNQYNKPDDMI